MSTTVLHDVYVYKASRAAWTFNCKCGYAWPEKVGRRMDADDASWEHSVGKTWDPTSRRWLR